MLRWMLVAALVLGGCGDDEGRRGDGGSGGKAGAGGSGGAGGMAGMGGMAGAGGGAEKPVVEIETSFGTMAIELEAEKMPNTTENFLGYVDEGFYAGTLVHRVLPNFVIQGGGFTTGLAPKTPTHPPIMLETNPEVVHVYGAISMARTDDPNSATCQFFLVNSNTGCQTEADCASGPCTDGMCCDVAPCHLNGSYAAFGKLIEGAEVLDAISAVATDPQDVPVDEVVIQGATRR